MANQTLYALFQTVSDAERAIGALTDHGVPAANIGVVARRPAEELESDRVRGVYTRDTDTGSVLQGEPIASYTQDQGTMPAAALASTLTASSTADTEENVNTVGKEGITTTTPQDAAAGAAVGTGVGLVGGLLAAAAALVVPGVGLVMAGGALAAAIGAAVATTAAGAAVGGVAGYLRDMGMPEHAVQNVADRVQEGDYLISVTVDSTQYDDIERLLLKYNATGVDQNITAAGEPIRQAWKNDEALQEYVETPPATVTGVPISPAGRPTTLTTTDGPEGMVMVPTENRPQTLTTIPEVAHTTAAKSDYVTEALDGTTIVHKDEPAGTFGQSRQVVATAQPGNPAQVEWADDEIDQHDDIETTPRVKSII